MMRLIGPITVRRSKKFQWRSANRDKIYQVVLESQKVENLWLSLHAFTCLWLQTLFASLVKWYIDSSGAQRPARGPHPARDESSSGPPCPVTFRPRSTGVAGTVSNAEGFACYVMLCYMVICKAP